MAPVFSQFQPDGERYRSLNLYLKKLFGEFKEALQEIEQKMKKIRLKGSFGKRMMIWS